MAGLRDRLGNLVTGDDARAWSGSVEDLLHEGERVETSVEAGTGRVVVTSHRVLAFTPDASGENVHGSDRPNVTDARPGVEGDDWLLYRGLWTGVCAAALLAAGFVVDVEAVLPTTSVEANAAEQIGVGGMIAAMNRVLALVSLLDDFLQVLGALALALTAVLLGVYVLTRERVLVVGVAGDDPDVHVPVPADRQDGALEELGAALFSTEESEA